MTFTFFDCFTEHLAEKKHNLGSDTLKMALTSVAPDQATDTQLSDLTEISYTNFGTLTLSVSASSQSGGTYKLVVTDDTISVSGGAGEAFRYVVVYNDTASNDELIGYFDLGVSSILNDGESISLDFDATNGFLVLARS